MPIIETQAQNISAYIPTNLISITDGQVYLSPELFQSGFLPAVDIGLSVSRVGGKTQISAMKKLAQQMRLAYTQFLELEQFTKFGTTLEEGTRVALEKGQRLREILKQPAHNPVPLAVQVLVLNMTAGDVLDDVDVADVRAFEASFRQAVVEQMEELLTRITEGGELTEADATAVHELAIRVKAAMVRKKG